MGEHRLDSQLVQVANSAGSRGSAAGLASARAHSLDVRHSRVRVIVQPQAGQITAAESAITAAGGQIEAQADGLVQALVAPGALRRVAASAAVENVAPPAVPVADAVDEGVADTGADVWQTDGANGTGVKIAIIDLGFYGYQSLLGTALPASVTTDDRCGGNLAASPAAGGTEHGTAVAEIVHQMAPGAQLYLMCVDSEVDLALAEQDAVADGVKIINHSVSWFDTSRGDGTGDAGSPDAHRGRRASARDPLGERGREHGRGSLERHVLSRRFRSRPDGLRARRPHERGHDGFRRAGVRVPEMGRLARHDRGL